MQNNKRIIVVTGQRASSTYHCQKIELEQYIEYLGELGHTTHHSDIGALKSPREIFKYLQEKPGWVLKIIPIAVKMTLNTETVVTEKHELLKQYYMLQNKESTIVIPLNLAPAFYKDILFMATEVYYLYRKDFVAQVKSMAIAITTTDFSPNRAVDKHLNVPVNVIHQAYGDVMANWMIVKDLYQCFPSKVIALEDTDITGPGQTKYPAYNNLHGNFFLIRDFDVAQHVFGISERRLR